MIIEKMKLGVQRYLIVQCEGASHNYDTNFVQKLFSEEGKGEVVLLNSISNDFGINLSYLFPSSPPESMCLDTPSKAATRHPSTGTWAPSLGCVPWNVCSPKSRTRRAWPHCWVCTLNCSRYFYIFHFRHHWSPRAMHTTGRAGRGDRL